MKAFCLKCDSEFECEIDNPLCFCDDCLNEMEKEE
jgi:hypothetical protein